MIIGSKGLGQSVENGPTTIGKDGVIQQGTPSGPAREGSRETYEGKIVSVPKDYCATPQGSSVVIIGYKIWAFQREATNLADSVTQTSLRSHVKGSIIKHCYGDEKGTLGGVCSGTHNGECTPKTWSETVTFGGRNAVRHNDEWWMNNRNTWGVLDYQKDMNQYSTDDAKVQPVAETCEMQTEFGKWVQQHIFGNTPPAIFPPRSPSSPTNQMSPGPAQPTTTPPAPPAGPLPPVPPTVPAQQPPATTPPLTAPQQGPTSPPGLTPQQQLPTTTPPRTAEEQANPSPMLTKRSEEGIGAYVRTTMKNPCYALAFGDPDGKGDYRGGSHAQLKGGDTEANHVPAWTGGASDMGPSYGMSPAGQMDVNDHQDLVSSSGSSQKADNWRAGTQDLTLSGNYRGAVAQDYRDIRNVAKAVGNPRKYNQMMLEMTNYRRCLEEHGLLPKKGE